MKYSISVPNRAKINKKRSKPAIDVNAKGPKKISPLRHKPSKEPIEYICVVQ